MSEIKKKQKCAHCDYKYEPYDHELVKVNNFYEIEGIEISDTFFKSLCPLCGGINYKNMIL